MCMTSGPSITQAVSRKVTGIRKSSKVKHSGPLDYQSQEQNETVLLNPCPFGMLISATLARRHPLHRKKEKMCLLDISKGLYALYIYIYTKI